MKIIKDIKRARANGARLRPLFLLNILLYPVYWICKWFSEFYEEVLLG